MKKQHIVLVEDDAILSKVLHEELEQVGYEVDVAENGVEGLRMIQKEKPQLVLLDVLMPEKNGFEVLEELKTNPATQAIPVIMLTMLSVDDDIKKGLKLGAEDYIVKSQHAVAEIVEKVDNFFGAESNPEAKGGIPGYQKDQSSSDASVGTSRNSGASTGE